uniref:7TM_GPCR_Srx domain-containing protein n=1 Tax=Heterorhabditis bacteriophora TaxID=37862 RepID=A0A1I7WA55_HETBA
MLYKKNGCLYSVQKTRGMTRTITYTSKVMFFLTLCTYSDCNYSLTLCIINLITQGLDHLVINALHRIPSQYLLHQDTFNMNVSDTFYMKVPNTFTHAGLILYVSLLGLDVFASNLGN